MKKRKMCPIRYIYHVLFFLLTQSLIISATDWKAYFDPNPVIVKTVGRSRVRLILSGLPDDVIRKFNNTDHEFIQLRSEDESLAVVRGADKMVWFELNRENKSYDSHFNVDGVFLGNFAFLSLRNQLKIFQ